MAAAIYFKIRGYEVGASQAGKLQYLAGSTWTNLGDWIANASGTIFIDSARNQIPIDYDIFEEGLLYQFRFIDSQGHPISNVVNFTFPYLNQPLLNVGGEGLLNLDGTPLTNP